jgi:2-(1,2-epoxy-1,2-dihydrophenyl)acetyl-CoA isomerase
METGRSLEPVIVERSDSFTRIVLNRPASLNAMNVELLERLEFALRTNADAPAIVLAGNGRAFCVGEDLRESLAPRTGQAEELRTSLLAIQEITRLITRLQCPVIASVRGYAVGGGAELALAADLIVADPTTRFRFPEVPLGHAPTGGVTARLVAAVGLLRAKDYLLTGRWIDATEVVASGLVNEIVPDPDRRAAELADELGRSPRRSMAATKLGIELAAFPEQERILLSEVDAALHCFAAPEAAASSALFRTEHGSRDRAHPAESEAGAGFTAEGE